MDEKYEYLVGFLDLRGNKHLLNSDEVADMLRVTKKSSVFILPYAYRSRMVNENDTLYNPNIFVAQILKNMMDRPDGDQEQKIAKVLYTLPSFSDLIPIICKREKDNEFDNGKYTTIPQRDNTKLADSVAIKYFFSLIIKDVEHLKLFINYLLESFTDVPEGLETLFPVNILMLSKEEVFNKKEVWVFLNLFYKNLDNILLDNGKENKFNCYKYTEFILSFAKRYDDKYIMDALALSKSAGELHKKELASIKAKEKRAIEKEFKEISKDMAKKSTEFPDYDSVDEYYALEEEVDELMNTHDVDQELVDDAIKKLRSYDGFKDYFYGPTGPTK